MELDELKKDFMQARGKLFVWGIPFGVALGVFVLSAGVIAWNMWQVHGTFYRYEPSFFILIVLFLSSVGVVGFFVPMLIAFRNINNRAEALITALRSELARAKSNQDYEAELRLEDEIEKVKKGQPI